jgi:hypothetical protein
VVISPNPIRNVQNGSTAKFDSSCSHSSGLRFRASKVFLRREAKDVVLLCMIGAGCLPLPEG